MLGCSHSIFINIYLTLQLSWLHSSSPQKKNYVGTHEHLTPMSTPSSEQMKISSDLEMSHRHNIEN